MEIITSRDNSKIKFAAKLLKSKALRDENMLFIAEGLRICYDAAQAGNIVKVTFITQDLLDKHPIKTGYILDRADDVYLIEDHVMAKISDTKTAQGIVCICAIPFVNGDGIESMDKSCKVLALENISDPGNMGTMVRTAEALGMSAVVLVGDCADVFSPKAVRSTMGSVVRMPIYRYESSKEFIDICRQKNLSVWAAVVTGDAELLSQTDMSKANVLFVGNEGNGLLSQTIDECEHKVTIDMSGRAESLNASASASILIWEMCRK